MGVSISETVTSYGCVNIWYGLVLTMYRYIPAFFTSANLYHDNIGTAGAFFPMD